VNVPSQLFRNKDFRMGIPSAAQHNADERTMRASRTLNQLGAYMFKSGCRRRCTIVLCARRLGISHAKSLLRNIAMVRSRRYARSGLAEPATRTQTPSGPTSQRRLPRLCSWATKWSQPAFPQQGDGTFEDISHSTGVDKIAFSKGVVAADYDNDGFVDFYVSNLYGGNFLYHNNHDRTFTEVPKSRRASATIAKFCHLVFRLRQRRLARSFVTSYFFSADEPCAAILVFREMSRR